MPKLKTGCLLGLLLVLTACGTPDADKETPPLSIATTTAFEKGDNPFRNPIMALTPYFSLTYTTLYRFDESLVPVPFLVERVERTDACRVILHLRRDFHFSDGTPIDGRHVLWSLRYGFRNARNPNPLFRRLVGGDEFVSGAGEDFPGLELLSDYALQLTFNTDNFEFPYYLASSSLSIVPVGWTADSLVTSAAYHPESIEVMEDRSLVNLSRNPGFPLEISLPDQLSFIFLRRRELFEEVIAAGDCDLFISPLGRGNLNSHPDFHLHKSPIVGSFYLQMNPERGALSDQALRRFILHLFDFPAMLQEKKWAFASPATHVISYGVPEYFLFKPFSRSPAEHPRPPGFIRLRAISTETGVRPELMEFVRSRLEEEKIILDIDWLRGQEFFDRLDRGDFDLAAFYHMLDVPIAIHFYEILFSPGMELNRNFKYPEAYELLAEYQRDLDEKRRLHLLARLEELARDQAVLVPVFNPLNFLGYRQRARDVRLNYLLHFVYQEKP